MAPTTSGIRYQSLQSSESGALETGARIIERPAGNNAKFGIAERLIPQRGRLCAGHRRYPHREKNVACKTIAQFMSVFALSI
jgi:hypothetical protein